MSFHSFMMITAVDGSDCDVAKVWTERRCIEEAAESIPGFQLGEILKSNDNTQVTWVHCCWDLESSYEEWLISPLRLKQTEDLASLASVLEIKTRLLSNKHLVKA